MLLIQILKSLLPIRYKLFIKYLLSINVRKYYNIAKNKRKIIVTLAADYGNLGDVAITYAQTKFLKANFPDYEVIDFPISKTFSHMKALKKVMSRQDIITIVGGGNMGDMYDDIEYCRQFIIRQFPNNKIVSFPQTIYFSDTKLGKRALISTARVYTEHKNLTLSAREEATFEKYLEYFPKNKIVLTPDIALRIVDELPEYQRTNITLCFRNDEEKRLGTSQEEYIINFLNHKYKKLYDIKYFDTHIDKNYLSVDEREFELNKIWLAFKKSGLVITDRLHGMIFCAITKTPCIAMDNLNCKISGVYNTWLSGLKFIKMIGEYDLIKLEVTIDELLNYDFDKESGLNLADKWNELLK